MIGGMRSGMWVDMVGIVHSTGVIYQGFIRTLSADLFHSSTDICNVNQLNTKYIIHRMVHARNNRDGSDHEGYPHLLLVCTLFTKRPTTMKTKSAQTTNTASITR